MTIDRAQFTRRRAMRARNTTLLGVVVNAVLAVIKGVAGVAGNSYALVADAIESLLDVFQGAIVFSALTIAAAGPDENHPYGHGKAEPLAAGVAAIGILGAAVGIAVESIRQILAPDPQGPAWFTIVVLVGVIVVKEGLFRHVFSVGSSVESTAVKVDAWHHRSDALTSMAAFVGIAIALIGGEGYESADDWAALAACGVIGYNGWRLLLPALGEVMDIAPPAEIEQTVRVAAEAVPSVSGTEACLVRKMGFEFYVDLHVLVNPQLTVREGHDIAHAVKDAICFADPRIRDVLIHIEPDDMPHLPHNRARETQQPGSEHPDLPAR
jgi:cation diffusion facilitator family transporter